MVPAIFSGKIKAPEIFSPVLFVVVIPLLKNTFA